MESLEFTVSINAPRPAVWDAVIGDQTYRIWAAEFAEGCYFEGSWEQGARIRFLSPGGSGMSAIIDKNRLHEFISIKHLGEIKDGVEDTESESVKRWAPAFENYSFSGVGASTEVRVTVDVAPEWAEYMQKAFPKALATLKAICESAGRGRGGA